MGGEGGAKRFSHPSPQPSPLPGERGLLAIGLSLRPPLIIFCGHICQVNLPQPHGKSLPETTRKGALVAGGAPGDGGRRRYSGRGGAVRRVARLLLAGMVSLLALTRAVLVHQPVQPGAVERLKGAAGPGPVHGRHRGEGGVFASQVAPFHEVSQFGKSVRVGRPHPTNCTGGSPVPSSSQD
jgi:hypothetical protein